jgi:hypothetical protein
VPTTYVDGKSPHFIPCKSGPWCQKGRARRKLRSPPASVTARTASSRRLCGANCTTATIMVPNNPNASVRYPPPSQVMVTRLFEVFHVVSGINGLQFLVIKLRR